MKYTKKQITESIAHWTKILEDMENRDILDIPLEEIKADLEGNAEIAQLPDGKWILQADAMMPPRDIDQKSATAYIKWIVNYIDTFNAKCGADVDLVCFDETEKKMGAKEIFRAENGEKLMRFFYAFNYMMKIA